MFYGIYREVIMNNKQLGTEFEREMVGRLSEKGWWTHFISPDSRGAQPFDIIAVKNGTAIAGDCKTCKSKTFSINRLEDNQIMAFQKWISCGNGCPIIFVKHQEKVYLIPFKDVYEKESVKINDFPSWEQGNL